MSGSENRERFERAMALFDELLELPVAERPAQLDRRCAGDEGLRDEVASLLEQADADDGFLESGRPGQVVREGLSGLVADEAGTGTSTEIPERLGPFKVLGLLGRGGMGTVYEAEQENPRRRIALKVLRAPFISDDLRSRFERESEILGRLRHPGIAHVYQAGLLEEGSGAGPVSYFAMELVEGIPLTHHAERERLDVRDRLALIAKVCDAVEHAHRHGVVHRDLKPENILVDGRGEPRVLDFGVARILDSETTARTAATATGLLVGTLPYMSPEQVGARTEEIDARSDVYTIGVVAYELLAGRLPLDVTTLSIPDAILQIRETDPPHIGVLDRRYRGDVGTIVGKALEKEPRRRYGSAAALSRDIQRYLADEPIRARPQSGVYRLRKFARRNKAVVAGTTLTLLALLGGAIAATHQAVIARKERAHAVELQHAAERQAYRARIAAAASAVESHDALLARGHLEEVPEKLRGWEWRHLHSRLDQSAVAIDTGVGRHSELRFSEDGERLEVRDVSTVPHVVFAIPLVGDHRPGEIFHVGLSRPQRVPARLRRQAIRSAVFGRGESVVEILDPGGGDSVRIRRCDDRPGRSSVRSLTADGRRGLMSMAGDDPARTVQQLCDLRTGEGGPVFTVPHAWYIALSGDGSKLAVSPKHAPGPQRVELFSTVSGARLRTLPVAVDDITALDMTPDGRFLVGGSFNGVLRLWNVETGKLLAERRAHDGRYIATVAFGPGGTRIASGSADNTIYLWSSDLSGDPVVLHGHAAMIGDICFSQSGRRLASVDRRGVIRVWELDDSLAEPELLRGHESYVNPVAYSHDGRVIVSGGWDGTLRLWDATSGELLRTFDLRTRNGEFGVTGLAVDRNGSRLAAGTTLGDLYVFDLATGRRLASADLDSRLQRIEFAPEGGTLFVGTSWEDLRILDASTLELVNREPFGLPFAWSPDGGRLLIRDSESGVAIREAGGEGLPVRLEPVDDLTTIAVWSPDGERIVTASGSGAVGLWDARTGELLGPLGTQTAVVHAAAIHPDGTRVAVGGADGIVRIHELDTREELARLRAHDAYVYDLAWSPDGETLVSGSGDGTLRLWHTTPRRERSAARARWTELRAEGSRLVDDHLDASADIAARLRDDSDLDPELRNAALIELLLREPR